MNNRAMLANAATATAILIGSPFLLGVQPQLTGPVKPAPRGLEIKIGPDRTSGVVAVAADSASGNFEEALKTFYAKFVAAQKPMDAELAKLLEEHSWDLYS
ncbi:MAG: hypothetical protein E6Q40_01535 [Cupriavidus sp.]|jgi:hypothetical protein|nr:MAG: hypothetical protein E6Q40_01535 [Cupriavidus sp.]